MNAYHLLSAEIAGLKLLHKTSPLFVDNAAYDKSRLVKKWLKKPKNIRLHFLPA
ncbi:MAG: hypothetical protein LBF88_11950 [Planctomycetaceae bacterium]|jgi:hypothetical protein|nr:hypothetical protein [Planctomycetaceae bacterium]